MSSAKQEEYRIYTPYQTVYQHSMIGIQLIRREYLSKLANKN